VPEDEQVNAEVKEIQKEGNRLSSPY
jgi:hypothetical protein